jgi:hypothetical protein
MVVQSKSDTLVRHGQTNHNSSRVESKLTVLSNFLTMQSAPSIGVSRNPIFLPRASSNLDLMESAFLNGSGMPHYNVAMGLGATSRVKDGQCSARHFNTGVCWGEFDAEHTRFVNAGDHDVSAVLEENRIRAAGDFSVQAPTSARTTNQMSLFAQSSHGMATSAPTGDTADGIVRSYGTYSNCPNCTLSGAAVYQCNLSNQKSVWPNNPSSC